MSGRIFLGSYEHLLAGYEISLETEEVTQDQNKVYKQRMLFGYSAHTGIVRSLSLSTKYLASGSSDENIKFYDVKRLREEYMISPEEKIYSLAFFGDHHLVAGGENGGVHFILHTGKGNWEIGKSSKAHSGCVNDVAIHGTSKAAITVGADSKLKLWDLTRGNFKKSFEIELNSPAERIAWSKSGEHAATIGRRKLRVYSGNDFVETASTEFDGDLRALHIHDDLLFCGGNKEKVHVFDLKQGGEVFTLTGMKGRIREIEHSSSDRTLTVATSAGFIYVWNLNSRETPLFSFDTGLRVTAMTIRSE